MLRYNNRNLKIKTKNGWESFSGILKTPQQKTVHIILEDGTKLQCTSGHRVKTDIGFQEASTLEIGQLIETASGLVKVQDICFDYGTRDVFDVVDAGIDHSYLTNGILSHNCEFLGSGNTLISGSKLRILDASWEEPEETKYHGTLRIYEKPKLGHTYAMCCDCATGQGGDAQAFQVIDVTEFPFKQVAAFTDNRLYYMQYPTRIVEVATWYNEAFVLVEINDVGQAVSYILQVEIGYDNLIKIKPKGKQGQHVSGGFQKMTQYGLKHNTATKRIGCNALKALIETDRLLLKDFKTIEELKTFVENSDSFSADEGSPNAHDDLVMSLVGFGWLSDQQFFKDSVGNNVRSNLERQMREIDDGDFIPFGFLDDGLDHTPESALDSLAGPTATPWA